LRQRNEKGLYTDQPTMTPEAQEQLYKIYEQRHEDRYNVNSVERLD